MTRITCECPRCGRVELGINDVTLVESPQECDAWYLFDCVSCGHQVVKTALSPVVAALSRVHVARMVVPAEVVERRPSGLVPQRPISTDDLLDLMLGLSTCHDPGTLLTEGTTAS